MDKKEQFKQDSLKYHAEPTPGKVALKTTTACETQNDLSKAYSPGVAFPCLEIKERGSDVWKYTAKGNTVAVVSDGTAVLGLGNIGPDAALPVMEGKCVLFKRFADIDAMPICAKDVFKDNGRTDPAKLIDFTEKLEPTFGGINLEDIGAPACFEVEQTLKNRMNIPVFHDDQHGTAIISQAAIINALAMTGKKLEDCKIVVNGAGAAGIACSEFYIAAGAKRKNFILCDSKGVIHDGRNDLTPEKQRFAVATEDITLEEAIKGADIFLGLSVADALSQDMVRSMNHDPIIFAMANPNPEILPDAALAAGAFVVGTGRSDYANQVNNVLGFPGIFRGALDVRAIDINEEMKIAASEALASIVNEPTPEEVLEVLTKAYPEDAAAGMFAGEKPLKNSYVIPKPFDPRVVPRVARFVAEAAMKSGMARMEIADLDAYEAEVAARIKRNLQK